MRIADRLRAVAEDLCELADELDMDAKAGGRQLADLEWSVRVRHAFDHVGIQTLNQLCRLRPIDLMRVPNIGALSLKEIQTKLAELGLSLRPDATKLS